MLRQQVQEDMKQAMKEKDAFSLETIRFVWSEIKNTEIDAKHDLSDEEIITLLQREVKRRKDSVELFEKGGRNELAEEEQKKLLIIEKYLPQMMDKTKVEKLVQKIIDEGGSDFGVVMGKAMGELKGKADGKMVSEVVKEKLAG
jgi:uncharacterized protein YqeY